MNIECHIGKGICLMDVVRKILENSDKKSQLVIMDEDDQEILEFYPNINESLGYHGRKTLEMAQSFCNCLDELEVKNRIVELKAGFAVIHLEETGIRIMVKNNRFRGYEAKGCLFMQGVDVLYFYTVFFLDDWIALKDSEDFKEEAKKNTHYAYVRVDDICEHCHAKAFPSDCEVQYFYHPAPIGDDETKGCLSLCDKCEQCFSKRFDNLELDTVCETPFYVREGYMTVVTCARMFKGENGENVLVVRKSRCPYYTEHFVESL